METNAKKDRHMVLDENENKPNKSKNNQPQQQQENLQDLRKNYKKQSSNQSLKNTSRKQSTNSNKKLNSLRELDDLIETAAKANMLKSSMKSFKVDAASVKEIRSNSINTNNTNKQQQQQQQQTRKSSNDSHAKKTASTAKTGAATSQVNKKKVNVEDDEDEIPMEIGGEDEEIVEVNRQNAWNLCKFQIKTNFV